MSTNLARDGRRRRVLHDEVRTASGLSVAGRTESSDAEAPRYGEQANIEHHPQITDFVPRRKRALLTTLAAGLGVAAGAEALSHFAASIASFLPGISAQAVDSQLAGGLAAWTSAVALLLVAALARITYSLRRHRVDDFRGRYRVWRWIGWAAMLASVNAVVHAHEFVSRVAVAATGWSLTAGGAEWWLIPLTVPAVWIAVRLVAELAEARGALAMTFLAVACYGVAAAGALGWAPAVLGSWADLLTRSLPLAGHVLALAGLMMFARYVVLDVQGLIEHKPRASSSERQAAKAAKAAAKATAKAKAKEEKTPATTPAPAAKSNDRPGTTHAWRDADEEASDDEEDENDGQYISKSERKRLRKLQQRQSRAA